MNFCDLAGVPSLTALGGCQLLWMALDTSLQYGVAGRGAAAFTLS